MARSMDRPVARLVALLVVVIGLTLPAPPPATGAVMCAGRPATLVMSSAGTVRGTDGADVIIGSAGPDVIRSGGGRDVVCAGAGKDRVHSQGGDDVVRGGDGADTLSGGNWRDSLLGGDGDDVIHGDSAQDVLFGQRGDDRLYGGVEADVLFGGRGADLLRGENGNDQILLIGDGDLADGGLPGILRDDADYSRVRSRGGVSVDLLAESGGLTGRAVVDRIIRFALVTGSDGPDVLRGDQRPNQIVGGEGRDLLDGRGRRDRLVGSGDDACLNGEVLIGCAVTTTSLR